MKTRKTEAYMLMGRGPKTLHGWNHAGDG
jgi:hypothetical protein